MTLSYYLMIWLIVYYNRVEKTIDEKADWLYKRIIAKAYPNEK